MRTALSSPWPYVIFGVVFGVHALSPRTASGDSRWTVPVALSIIDRGDTDLDEYRDMMRREQYYAVECVYPDGAIMAAPVDACTGHYYNAYPVSVPALATPFIVVLRAGRPVFRMLVPASIASAHPEFAALLGGDLVQARAVVEEWIASFFIALAAVVTYATARRYLPVSVALLLAFVLAFATPAWSSGSRAFGMHAPSMFLVALAVYFLLRGEERPSLIPWTGLLAAAAYALRPTNALLVIFAGAYIFDRHRRRFPLYLLCGAPVAIAFVAYNLSVYHSLFSPYFTTVPWPAGTTDTASRVALALAGQLISPSRGLLIFTPLLLFSLWGMFRAWRERWEWPLSRYLILWVGGHWLLISLYVDTWWGGHSYGPRFFTDLMPIFVFFLIPPIQAWRSAAAGPRRLAAAAFLVLLGASVFFHSRGAFSLDAQNWSGTPVDVDRDPARLWDWSDPQFLRGLHSGQHETVNRTR